jgi:hypothetical protein
VNRPTSDADQAMGIFLFWRLTDIIVWVIRRYDSLAVKRQQYVTFRRKVDVYEFDYVVANNAL